MNFSIKRPFVLSSLISDQDDMSLSNKILNTPIKASRLVLGLCSATIAFPLVTLAVFCSVFFSEEKWEEFWDKFLEA